MKAASLQPPQECHAREYYVQLAGPCDVAEDMHRDYNHDSDALHLASDCFPEPPTPTSIAFPRGWLSIRVIRHTCSMACSPEEQQGWQRTRNNTATSADSPRDFF